MIQAMDCRFKIMEHKLQLLSHTCCPVTRCKSKVVCLYTQLFYHVWVTLSQGPPLCWATICRRRVKTQNYYCNSNCPFSWQSQDPLSSHTCSLAIRTYFHQLPENMAYKRISRVVLESFQLSFYTQNVWGSNVICGRVYIKRNAGSRG